MSHHPAVVFAGLPYVFHVAAILAVTIPSRPLRRVLFNLALVLAALAAVAAGWLGSCARSTPGRATLLFSAGEAALALFGLVLLIAALHRVVPRRAHAPPPPPPEPTTLAVQKRVATAWENEHLLLGHDLHDGLAQLLIAAKMHLDTYCSVRGSDAAAAERELALASRRLQDAVDEVNRLISGHLGLLREGVTLGEAVRRYLQDLAQAHGWRSDLDNRLGDRRLSAPVETAIYRVVQEALSNAAKHSRTERVRVVLAYREGWAVATVEDWGTGLMPAQLRRGSRGVGLEGMCRRARLMGGECIVEATPGRGTRVTVRIPCAERGGLSKW